MAVKAEQRARRRKRVMAMREQGMTVTATAAKLGVSPATVLRDRRAAERKFAEQADELANGRTPYDEPLRVSRDKLAAIQGVHGREDRLTRQLEVSRLHRAGASFREIGVLLGIGRSTAQRDLRHLRGPGH